MDSSSSPSLEAIVQRYAPAPDDPGTATGTDKATTHAAYLPIYAALFSTIRETVRHLVELGVDSGASAAAWATYFPNAAVTGIDLSLAGVRHTHPRVSFIQGDATQPPPPHPGLGVVDIVIDDASHRPDDQLASLAVWGPRCRHMMILEDVAVQAPYAAFQHLATRLGLVMEAHDLRATTGRFDDCLLVFTRCQ
jgi:hypothetical protein